MISKRVEKALAAYNEKDIHASKQAHEKSAIENDLHGQSFSGRYIGDFVYGALDGIITTFAVVAAVAGAKLSAGIILIVGFANLFGDGFSMATGNYLSTKAEREFHKQERKREEWEIENVRDGEVEEIRQIYMKKGFKGRDLDRAVKIITSNKKIWVDTMMLEELNISPPDKEPWQSALATFISFISIGFIPLLSFVFAYAFPELVSHAFTLSIWLTAFALFSVGAAKVMVKKRNW